MTSEFIVDTKPVKIEEPSIEELDEQFFGEDEFNEEELAELNDEFNEENGEDL